jgi:hypothetical protein
MAEDIDRDLERLSEETREKCQTLETCLLQIESYHKVRKSSVC